MKKHGGGKEGKENKDKSKVRGSGKSERDDRGGIKKAKDEM